MAERLKVIIEGDSSGLGAALKSAETRLNSFNTRVSNNSRALTGLMKTLNQVGSGFTRLDGLASQTATAMARMTAAANAAAAAAMRQADATNRQSTAVNRSAAAQRNHARSSGMMNLGLRDLIMGMTSLNTLLYTSAFLFGGVVKTTIDANAKFEKMQVLLKNISTAGTEAGKAISAKRSMDFLWNMADNAPFKIDALSDSFVKLKASGIDPTKGSLQSLVDTVAYFGGDTEQLKRAGVALSQMLSKGKVTAEELRQQLGDAVPNAMKDMAKALDMTIPQLDAKMKKGLVLSADAVPKLLALWKKQYGGAAEGMMGTWDGLMTRMSNAYQKMVLRVTGDQGPNSLFAVLKKNFLDLTNFMNSNEGDEFFGNVTKGIGTVINAIVSGLKFLYEYRDTIVAVGKVMLAVWVGGKILSGIGAIGSAINGTLGAIRGGMAAWRAFAGISDGLSLSLRYLGENFTAAAMRMGVFNSAGQISRAGLLTLGGGIATVTGLLALIGAGYYAAYQKQVEAAKGSDTYRNALATTQNVIRDNIKLSASYVNAMDSEVDAIKRVIDQKWNEAKARVATAKIAVAAARETAKAANAQYNAARDPTTIRGNAPSAIGSALGAIPGLGIPLKIAARAAGQLGFGFNPFNGGERQSLAASRANANLSLAEQNAQAADRNMDILLGGITGRLDNLINGEKPFKTDVTPAGGGGKKKADPLGDLDGSRSQLVSLMMANSKTGAEIKDNGDGKEVEKYARGAEALQETTEAQVKAIKSQAVLNERIREEKAARTLLAVQLDKHKDALAQLKKEQSDLENLTASSNDQMLRAKDAVGALDTSYNGVANTVERYANKLKEQHKESLSSTNGEIKSQAVLALTNEVYAKRLELLAEAAGRAKDSAIQIEDSLLTEDGARQAAYRREVDRINALMLAAQSLNANDRALVEEQLRRYLDAVAAKNKVDSNPLLKWAKEAGTVKEGMNNALGGWLDGFVDKLAEGKLAFKDFAKSMLKEIAKIIFRALIAKAILMALGLGGPTAAGTRATQDSSLALINDPANSGIFHTGGVVGGKAPGMKNVDPGVFGFAKKYHTGGFPGLRSDEVPIIAQKGEGVFTKDQMKALGGGMGGQAQAPVINIINQTGTPIKQEQSAPRMDLDKMVVDIVLKNADKPGPLRDKLQGMNR